VEPEEVEIEVKNVGPFDVNCAPVGITIVTGPGKNNWRKRDCSLLREKIARQLQPHLPKSCWKGKPSSYVWLLAGGASSFSPIEFPNRAR
jgi:hypothetical protein